MSADPTDEDRAAHIDSHFSGSRGHRLGSWLPNQHGPSFVSNADVHQPDFPTETAEFICRVAIATPRRPQSLLSQIGDFHLVSSQALWVHDWCALLHRCLITRMARGIHTAIFMVKRVWKIGC